MVFYFKTGRNLMPLIALDRFTEHDILSNDKCFFIYKENEKREGGNHFLRSAAHGLPLTMKASPSYGKTSYWYDIDFRYNVEMVEQDIDRIRNILNLGGIVFIESKFLQEEDNSPMKTTAPKTLDYITYALKNLFKIHQPKYISPNLRSPRTVPLDP